MASGQGTGTLNKENIRRLVEEFRPRHVTAQKLILEVIREAILSGELPAGSRLRQEELADFFDTSRIPVREALRVLEHHGLVTSEPHRGFTVTKLDADQIEEIYELRAVLEGHAVRLAIPLLTEQDLAELKELYDGMSASADSSERLANRDRFHMRLYEVTARPRLLGLIEQLRKEVNRSLRFNMVEQSSHAHEAFFDAVKNGDADAAAAELEGHFRKVAALLRRFVRQAKQDGNIW